MKKELLERLRAKRAPDYKPARAKGSGTKRPDPTRARVKAKDLPPIGEEDGITYDELDALARE